ncbi:MAG: PD-(D/E)XK nuclease domain-containing protein, partial [Anaerolineales bacterium]
NFAMDYNKIAYVSRLPNGEDVVLNALDESRQLCVEELADRFGVREMLREVQNTAFMASLLYYLGVLTLGGIAPQGELVLEVPNLVVRKLYAERLQEMLLPDGRDQDAAKRAAQALYQRGEMQPLCDFIEQHYFRVFDNRDYRWAREMTIKTAFLTLLYNDVFYIMDSETALEHSYADMTMILRPEMRQYQLLDILIEFKYLKLKDASLAELAALDPIQKKMTEAKTRAQAYRQYLEDRYGEMLRLRTYAVTALGLERLVWEEV